LENYGTEVKKETDSDGNGGKRKRNGRMKGRGEDV